MATFCEVKNRSGPANERSSYIEAAGKASCSLYAQDGRHSAPCIHILGSSIYLTIFDHGGSLSTTGFNIHTKPDVLLRILVGVSAGTLNTLGFDTSIEWYTIFQDGNQEDIKQVTIERNGQPSFTIELTRVLFISDNLHGRGTTVWEGMVLKPGTPGKPAEMTEKARRSGRVVVKDSWIDPLRKYTEGMILTILHENLIEGVPKLIHKQQVKAAHPSSRANKTVMVNNSTHTIRSMVDQYLYHLRVLSRVVTKPASWC